MAAWAASPTDTTGDQTAGRTIRMIVTPHTGGRRVRVRLTNRFGDSPVRFADVRIARRRSGASLVAGTNRRLLFDGVGGITLQAGQEAVSDSARLRFRPFQDLAVSAYIPGPADLTRHFSAE
jgi:hypothetical protein